MIRIERPLNSIALVRKTLSCSILTKPVVSFLKCSVIGGTLAQSVKRATLGEEVPVRFPLWPPARHWLGRCQYNVTG